jgi:membrane dipeptidase
MSAVLVAAIGDLPVIAWRPRRGIAAVRRPEGDELYSSTSRQLDALIRFRETFGFRPLRSPGELPESGQHQARWLMLTIEGADFLEGRLGRLEDVYQRGVRSLQLVHYRINEVGDIQTASPKHGGLTPFGRDVVREANGLGMVIDLAHATFEVTKAVIDLSIRPVMISHTNLQDDVGSLRFVSREHARLVADAGGIIGAWPFSPQPRFSAFIDRIIRLVDAVGPDHVAIGTDMDGLGPYAVFGDYAHWPSIPAALLARGVARADVAKLMGENFRRLFEAVAGK